MESTYIQLLPSIHPLVQPQSHLASSINSDLNDRKQRIQVLKKYFERNLFKNDDSVQYLETSDVHIQSQIDRFKHRKHASGLPQYLKEDLPQKGIHQARLEARKLSQGLNGESPTALQYSQMLDYITAFKGIPQYMRNKSEKKKVLQVIQSSGKLIKSLRSEKKVDQVKQDQQMYKRYFGSEGLQLNPQQKKVQFSSSLILPSNISNQQQTSGRYSIDSVNVAQQYQLKNMIARTRNSQAATTTDALDTTLSAPYYKHAPQLPSDAYGSNEGSQKSLIDWKEITGGSYAVKQITDKHKKAINFFLEENRREESLEMGRKVRAQHMHTLQGPLQLKLSNKRFECQDEEIKDRIQHIIHLKNHSSSVEISKQVALEVQSLFDVDYNDSRQSKEKSRERKKSNSSSNGQVATNMPRMPDKQQQQVVDTVIIKGTLLPGLTKASMFSRKNNKQPSTVKRRLSPYQDIIVQQHDDIVIQDDQY